jgi:Ca2+-binding EF-hand superfamily protein
MAQSNVTVLTSSSADKVSREDKAWSHGAFTQALLEAFGRAADTNHDGVVSVSELTDYLARRVPALTGGQQQPGIEQRFWSDILVAGL